MQFHNTHIYSRSLQLAQITRDAIASFPPGHAYLADQLRRATSSILLNFAEGYGKRTHKDQRRFFDIARGSTNEVAAAFDFASVFELVDPIAHHQALDACDHLARMLTRFRR